MGRPREHDDAMAARLLEAAGRALHEHGPDAISVRGLAEELGTTTRAVYSLFGSKQELMRALFRTGFERLYERQAAVPLTGDPQKDIVALALAYRQTALENRHLYDLMFSGVRGFEPGPDDRELAVRTLRQLRDAVRAAAEAGRLPRDVRSTTLQLWALVHGLSSLELQGLLGDARTAERCWRQAATALLRGHQP